MKEKVKTNNPILLGLFEFFACLYSPFRRFSPSHPEGIIVDPVNADRFEGIGLSPLTIIAFPLKGHTRRSDLPITNAAGTEP